MGIEVALLAVAAIGTAASISQGVQARKSAASAKKAGDRAQSESKAQQASEAAAARRQQIREERVRRARVLQAGENTGTEGSSGEFGAIGALSTNLGNNLGVQQGRIASAGRQSNFLQDQADLNFQAQQEYGLSQMFGQVGSLALQSSNIFAPAPAPTQPPKP